MELEGNRIRLLPISHHRSDTENIVRWRNQEFVRSRFIDRRLFTIQSHEKWMDTMVDSGKAVQFIIIIKAENKPIGSVYLKNIDHGNEKAEYGIFIGEEACLNRGFGQEAARIVLTYAFEELHLHKIYLRVFAWNQPAVCCYKKAGFQEEARLKDEVKREGRYYDLIFMSAFAAAFTGKGA